MLAAASLVGVGCFPKLAETVEVDAEVEVRILPRADHLTTYPCVEQCHVDRDPDPHKRPLQDFHTLRSVRHGPSMFWCPFCHKPDDLDRLHLLDGTPVPFDAAHRLCGQCHGSRLADWEKGIHGLQTGNFMGVVERRSCPVCHDPHDPHRPKFEALPPPAPPHWKVGDER
jgi:hypothetical protein